MAAQQPPSEPNIDVTSPYTPRRPAPIISLSINHPIGTALRKLKNFLTHKQTLFATTFTIKVTPIVAMVSLLGVAALFGGGITTAYQFGKTVEQKFLTSSPTPTPKVIVQAPAVVSVSKAGTVKATYGLPIQNTQNAQSIGGSDGQSSQSSQESMTPTVSPQPILHYILVQRNGSIVYLTSSSTVHLQNYLNLRVLITGNLDSTKNTLTVAKTSDIEILQ